jgi:hypothetical protein
MYRLLSLQRLGRARCGHHQTEGARSKGKIYAEVEAYPSQLKYMVAVRYFNSRINSYDLHPHDEIRETQILTTVLYSNQYYLNIFERNKPIERYF